MASLSRVDVAKASRGGLLLGDILDMADQSHLINPVQHCSLILDCAKPNS